MPVLIYDTTADAVGFYHLISGLGVTHKATPRSSSDPLLMVNTTLTRMDVDFAVNSFTED